MKEIIQLRQEGLSVSEIGRLLDLDRKTVRKYLADPRPRHYGRSAHSVSPLAPYIDYIQARLAAGVWNAVVLLAELKSRGYRGGYTILTDFMRPLRVQAKVVATRRYETPPGRQAQVDWAEVGTSEGAFGKQALHAFVLTLGSSRAMYAEVATDTSLATFLNLHERAFAYLGGVPEEILYDNDGMVIVPSGWTDGQPTLQPDLLAYSEHHRYRIKLCRPRRAQTKGKIERGVRYVRQSFLCGRRADSIQDLNSQLLCWMNTVANVREHGTTHRLVNQAWEEERSHLRPHAPLPLRLLARHTVRRVPKDCFVCYKTCRYSVPWRLAGQEVGIIERAGALEIYRDETLVARHELAHGRYLRVAVVAHHDQMPYGTDTTRKKASVHLSAGAPSVEQRSLSAYEEAAA